MANESERRRNFLVTPEFILSAYELPKECGRKIFKALSLFIINPRHPSLNFEQLDSRTGMLASIRIDEGYRIILSGESTATLLYVGTHDKAYQFAKKTAFAPNQEWILEYKGRREPMYDLSSSMYDLSKPAPEIKPLVSPPDLPCARLSVEKLDGLMVRSRKYLPLALFLANSIFSTSVEVSFGEIEAMLGSPLPKSARTYNAWWANDSSHVQANSWLALDWRTSNLELSAEKVTFVRDFGK